MLMQPECKLKAITRGSLWTGGRRMNPSISMQVGQAAGDIVPVWGRVSSAWVIVIVEVGMIPGPGG